MCAVFSGLYGYYGFQRSPLFDNTKLMTYGKILPHGRSVRTCAARSAARQDRIYVSANFSGKKLCVDTIAPAFTDHFAVCLWVEVDVPQVRRGRGLWKLNRQLLDDSNIGRRFQQEWTRWRKEPKSRHSEVEVLACQKKHPLLFHKGGSATKA